MIGQLHQGLFQITVHAAVTLASIFNHKIPTLSFDDYLMTVTTPGGQILIFHFVSKSSHNQNVDPDLTPQ
jgi:thiamine biosynthesis protein ThiC